MQSLSDFKRGDTFSLVCVWKENGTPTSIAGLTIVSQIRKQVGKTLVASLTVVPSDQTAHPGQFTLVAPTSTSGWPVGLLVCDFQITQGDVVRSSETFQIRVIEDVSA